MSSSQYSGSLLQALSDTYQLLSRAGISVVESREYLAEPIKRIDILIERPLSEEQFEELARELASRYGVAAFQLRHEAPIIRLAEVPEKGFKWKLPLVIATIITVFLTGLGLSQGYYSALGGASAATLLISSVTYTALFIGALLLHELGHVLASRRAGVRIEGPVLIPAPPIQLGFIGTFGAIIFMKSLPARRRELARVGVSGPLLGFIAGTIIGLAGLALSERIPIELAEAMAERGELSPLSVYPLGFALLAMLKGGEGVLVIHPVLFIAYVVYLVTFLNLLPIGQLDGGHVVRSFTSARAHARIGSLVPVALLVAGLSLFALGLGDAGSFYAMLAVVTFLLKAFVERAPHPGPSNQYDRSSCKWCAVAYAALLALTLPLP